MNTLLKLKQLYGKNLPGTSNFEQSFEQSKVGYSVQPATP